jgi:hypothetical protein
MRFDLAMTEVKGALRLRIGTPYRCRMNDGARFEFRLPVARRQALAALANANSFSTADLVRLGLAARALEAGGATLRMMPKTGAAQCGAFFLGPPP